MLNFLSGRKTYLTALIMGAIGVAKLAGVEIPGFEQADAGQLIGNAMAFAFLRSGVKSNAV
jgi:hypothetical protein